MADVRNTCDGTDGVTVTNLNSQGPDQFNTVSIGTNCTVTFDASQKIHGNTAVKILTPGVAAAAFVRFVPSPAYTSQTVYFRTYLYVAAPVSGARVFNCSGSSIGLFSVDFSATGQLRALNTAGGLIGSMTSVVPVSQWVRVEGKCVSSATVGQVELKLFDVADSPTPLETYTSAASQNTGGQTGVNFTFGPSGSGAINSVYWLDDVGVSEVGYMGPTGIVPPIAGDLIIDRS